MAKDDAEDRPRRLLNAITNGPGTLASRVIVLFATPIMAILAALLAYSIKATLENISLAIHQVSVKIDNADGIAKDAEFKVNQLQTDVGRLQERATNVDHRLDRLEGQKR